MQVVVLNGTLSEAEQDVYIKQVTARCPIGLIEKLFLNVQGKQVDVHYTRHRFRELRKMGGYCIGEPMDWNYEKGFSWVHIGYDPQDVRRQVLKL